MTAGVITTIVLGVLSVVGTIIGCTWKLSGKISSLDSSVKVNTVKTNDIHAIVTEHVKDCDTHRVKLNEQVKSQGKRLDNHDDRISGLEAC